MAYDLYSNTLINIDCKVRIPLSASAEITVSDDMATFGVTQKNAFINTVLENYFSKAKASLSKYIENRTRELKQLLEYVPTSDNKEKDVIIKAIVDKEAEDIAASIRKSINTKNSSNHNKSYYINAKNMQTLQDGGHIEYADEDGLYKQRPGRYLRAVIEEYCSLPFIEREHIYKQDIYETVEKACNEKRLLKIPNPRNSKKPFEVYPYRIVPNKSNTQSYLLCYSVEKGSPKADKRIASFNMARLNIGKNNCGNPNSAFLSQNDIKQLEATILNEEVEYVLTESEHIKVRLTDHGKDIYNSRIYMRPRKIGVDEANNIWEFFCTQKQAFNFFFSFAEDVEIISPPELRKRFAKSTANMAKIYSSEQ